LNSIQFNIGFEYSNEVLMHFKELDFGLDLESTVVGKNGPMVKSDIISNNDKRRLSMNMCTFKTISSEF
jgi:hypothetical protein